MRGAAEHRPAPESVRSLAAGGPWGQHGPPWRSLTDPVRQSCRFVPGELPHPLSAPGGRWQGRLPSRQWWRSARSVRAV